MAAIHLLGRPTGPDVEAILREIPTDGLKPGDIIQHERIEDIIKQMRTDNRYDTVADAWRKRLDREFNIVVGKTPDGFEVLNNSQRVDVASRRLKSSMRRTSKAAALCSRTSTNGLRPDECKARDHVIRVGATIVSAFNTDVKQLRYEMKAISDQREASNAIRTTGLSRLSISE